MKQKTFEKMLILLIIISLITLYLISSFEYIPIKTITDCGKKIKIIIKINETFYSKKGNYFGKTGNFIIYLEKFKFINKGDTILIYGRSQRKNETCFIFPEKIKMTKIGEENII